jgi:hypothetical protein
MRKPSHPLHRNHNLAAELAPTDLTAVRGGDGDLDSIEKAVRAKNRRVEFQLVSEVSSGT